MNKWENIMSVQTGMSADSTLWSIALRLCSLTVAPLLGYYGALQTGLDEGIARQIGAGLSAFLMGGVAICLVLWDFVADLNRFMTRRDWIVLVVRLFVIASLIGCLIFLT